jgi:phosphatidylserine/phosphatidylglycerophosphate/cardiolipin synthase-like enzyme
LTRRRCPQRLVDEAKARVGWIDGWSEEGQGIGVNVNWIHTKFMLIDPLGSKSVTLTGSADWSVPSVTDNDENVLVIPKSDKADLWRPKDLFGDPQDWVPAQFALGSEHDIKRRYFAGR